MPSCRSATSRDACVTASVSAGSLIVVGELLQPAARDHQLADEIHQRVEPVQIDPDVPVLARRQRARSRVPADSARASRGIAVRRRRPRSRSAPTRRA